MQRGVEVPYFHDLDVSHIHDSVVLLDVDGALCPHNAREIAPAVRRTVERLRASNELYICSNNADRERTAAVAHTLGVPVLAMGGRKPYPDIHTHIPPNKPVVVIGDKWITDGRQARLAGGHYIRVRRYRDGKEDILTRLSYVLDALWYAIDRLWHSIALPLISRGITHAPLMVRYGVAGIVGACIQLSADYVLVELVGMWYLSAVALGFVVALLCTFLLQKYWTFKDAEKDRFNRQLRLYSVIAAGSFVGNILLMHLLVSGLGYWYLSAQVITIVCVTGVSFLCNNIFTFAESGIFRSLSDK